MTGALTAARLRARIGLDDAIGASLTVLALVVVLAVGIHDSRRPVYGPIDEMAHTAYVLAVAKDGIPPQIGRDRAFIGHHPLAPRDVRIPGPDKVGSAPLPIGAFGDVMQAEAIQPPMYYYAAAPVTWFVAGRDKVVALRIFDVFLCLCAMVLVFLAVRDLAGSPLGGAVAATLMGSAGGIISIFSFVTNGAMMLTLGAAAIWLGARGIRDRRVTWLLALVAAGLAITQIIVVPLAAVCLLAPAVMHLRSRGRSALRTVSLRVGAAGVPLALWVLANLWRYHWILPQAAGTSSFGGFSTTATTTNIDIATFSEKLYVSLVTVFLDSFHWWDASPYIFDYRPLAIFVPVTLIGIACALLRGTVRQRNAIALFLIALVAAHLTVFGMLYLAVILTGGGDFVYRYFSAAEAAAACIAGASFSAIFRNPNLERCAAIVACLVLAYWTYNASPL